MKILCIIQARMGSTRLPGKILKEVKGLPLLGHEIKRVELAKKISKIVLATTTLPEDDKTEEFCKKINIACFRGSVDDVLDRYYEAATEFGSFDAVMRLTGDCPLIDPIILDQLVEFFEQGRFDYASNVGKETFPDGMDAEIFTVKALEEAYREARLKSEREHVTSYIRKSNHFKKGNLESSGDYSAYRFTVDNPEDFEVIKFIIENSDENFGYLDYIELIDRNVEVKSKNMKIMRNEGYAKSLKEDKNL